MTTYRLSPAGRRTTIVLLLGALAIWAFALWGFRSTLNLDYHPLRFWGSLNASIEQGLTISQVVPALLMLILIVVTPLLFWNLLEEWAAAYTPTDEGLRFASLGITIVYPWEDMQAVRTIDDDSDEPLDEIHLSRNHNQQIRNPLLRFLHAQAYGRRTLPIYSGLAQRDKLLGIIHERAGIVRAGDVASPASSERASL